MLHVQFRHLFIIWIRCFLCTQYMYVWNTTSALCCKPRIVCVSLVRLSLVHIPSLACSSSGDTSRRVLVNSCSRWNHRQTVQHCDPLRRSNAVSARTCYTSNLVAMQFAAECSHSSLSVYVYSYPPAHAHPCYPVTLIRHAPHTLAGAANKCKCKRRIMYVRCSLVQFETKCLGSSRVFSMAFS